MIVVCIDDDTDDTDMFRECINRVDHSITCLTVNDGPSAISLLTKGELPDIIFIDVNMPVMNGKDVLAIIKSNYKLKSIPVVMYSGRFDLADAASLTSLGAHGFLQKQDSLPNLEKAIRKFLKVGA
jgi:CheY-like chemotaxis protein